MAATQLYGAGYPAADKPYQLYGPIYYCRFANLIRFVFINGIYPSMIWLSPVINYVVLLLQIQLLFHLCSMLY